jgi:hypothetical protein
MGFTSVRGSASFWCLTGPDFSFWYRSRSESYPMFYTCYKTRKVLDFYSQQYQPVYIVLSFYSASYRRMGQYIDIFWKNSYLSFTFDWNTIRIRIRQNFAYSNRQGFTTLAFTLTTKILSFLIITLFFVNKTWLCVLYLPLTETFSSVAGLGSSDKNYYLTYYEMSRHFS